jgi:RND family efflux transporter MFP subunit
MFQANNSLLTIIDASTVVVHAKLPLSYLNMVHTGQEASVAPSALPNLHFSGTISTIIPLADPQTDTFEVWVSIPNKNMPKNSALLPGMSAFVRIQSPATALVVPRLAVLNPDGDATVYVVQNQVAHLRHVQVIGRSVENIYISGGLSPATQIVLVGLDQLQDNQKVHVTRTE